MRKNFIDIMFTFSATALIYFGNHEILDYNIFLLILITTLSGNYFSFLSLIPLCFISTNLFFTFLIIYVMMSFVNWQIKNRYYKYASFILVSAGYLIYSFFFIYTLIPFLMFQVILIFSIIILNTIKISNKNFINSEVLILSLSILNIRIINPFLYLLIYSSFVFTSITLYKKYYLILTGFLITIYSIVTTNNLTYILTQIIAYLGCLYFIIKKGNSTNNQLEFLMEDINLNVSTFCSFLNQFSSISNNSEYEKAVSDSVKILIESYCSTCKEKVNCYGKKKLKTYIFLKELLTNKKQINNSNENKNIFECKYYFYMCEKALQLQKQYNLTANESQNESTLYELCSSIQNYFISLFEKQSSKTLILTNFKNFLNQHNIHFSKFDYSIKNENEFYFKVYPYKQSDLIVIFDKANDYFKSWDIDTRITNQCVTINPKKSFKVIYEHATLSSNDNQISGDNIMFKTTTETNFICALSDGMGSGYRAYELSQETLKMVDLITNCNISFDAALQILNSFFKAKDRAECYATLDLVEINLLNGFLNLYKLGSSTTYISRGDKIIPIYNNNLPFGISDLITKEQFLINDNDLIVLVSDGINDYIDENKLINFIESIKNESPHKIVYEILQKIYYDNGKIVKDDMSCVAIKVKEI